MQFIGQKHYIVINMYIRKGHLNFCFSTLILYCSMNQEAFNKDNRLKYKTIILVQVVQTSWENLGPDLAWDCMAILMKKST